MSLYVLFVKILTGRWHPGAPYFGENCCGARCRTTVCCHFITPIHSPTKLYQQHRPSMAISVAINTYEEDGLYSGEEVVAVFDAELELTDDAIAVAENGNTSNLAITKVIPSNSTISKKRKLRLKPRLQQTFQVINSRVKSALKRLPIITNNSNATRDGEDDSTCALSQASTNSTAANGISENDIKLFEAQEAGDDATTSYALLSRTTTWSSMSQSTADFSGTFSVRESFEGSSPDNQWDAAKNGDYATLLYLSKNHTPYIWTRRDTDGNVPLYYACRYGGSFGKYGIESVKLLCNLYPETIPNSVMDKCKRDAYSAEVLSALVMSSKDKCLNGKYATTLSVCSDDSEGEGIFIEGLSVIASGTMTCDDEEDVILGLSLIGSVVGDDRSYVEDY
jgi:hypothetical protein